MSTKILDMSGAGPGGQPRRPRLRDAAYVRIKRDIVRCALEPGVEVTETQLARRYKLGKASVRAALMLLNQEGLVCALPRRGHLITPVTLKDVHEMFDFRVLIEPATARLAAGRLDRGALKELERLTHQDNLTGLAFNHANTEFHLAIARAAGNRRIVEALSQIHDQIARLLYLKLAPPDQVRSYEEHHTIIRALAAGDEAGAERAAAAHIVNAKRDVLAAAHSSADLMGVQITGR
jgi:DNA-binding GntR family transcriptional regulator